MKSNRNTLIIAAGHEPLVMYHSILRLRMGFTVTPARNGEDVLNILETILPDLAITGRKIPFFDGLTTLKAHMMTLVGGLMEAQQEL